MLPRFLAVGERGLQIPLEAAISHFLPWLFPEMEVVERVAFRLTRDGDTEISDDADDLLEAVESELQRGASAPSCASRSRARRRRRCSPGSRSGSASIPTASTRSPGCSTSRTSASSTGSTGPTSSTSPGSRTRSGGSTTPSDDELFAEIAQRDIVVQHPYDSFATSVESFVRAAAKEPNVVTLKTTVYRTSHDSALAPALMLAAENGKQSVCVVELKARFDERRNIEWARSLEQAGVHVVYGFPDMKIHAKTTLVVRREGDELKRYVHIGTGNYHATTARIYEDVGLFTADPDIAADVADLFNFVTGFGRPQQFRKILAAPFNLRTAADRAHPRRCEQPPRQGKTARIRIKVNNLTDADLVEELYRASQAGAQIDLIVRAVCTLVPGVEGLSENIRVRSVLGRFLEHSRLYCFEAGDEKTYLLGSADLMPRNLDHRIEVVVPVEDVQRAQRARGDLQGAARRQLAGVGSCSPTDPGSA